MIMSEKEKKEEQKKNNEIDLEDLEKVSGGGLRDVYITPTKDIDEDIKKRIYALPCNESEYLLGGKEDGTEEMQK